MAPEVHAAWRARGHPIEAVEQTQLMGFSLGELVGELTVAHRVDIVGVLPRALGEALLDADGDQPTTRPADRFVYFTPRRERVLAYRHEKVMGRVIQRWSAGLVCFQNWTERSSSRDPAESAGKNVYPIDDLFLECIVVSHCADGRVRVFTLTLLPPAVLVHPTAAEPVESLIISEVADSASVSSVVDRMDALRASSRPAAIRRVVCNNGAVEGSEACEPLPNEFVPHLAEILPYGTTEPAGAFVPATVVALYSESALGPGLLLKHRTALNSHTDFDTLALFSQRVAEEDLAFAVKADVPEHIPDDQMLDHWWKVLDKPSPITLPHDVFVAAGQRELFVSTGLDIEASRFVYCGSLVVKHEDHGYYLGFLGFRIVLRRDHDVDELHRALRWNSDLEFVRGDQLYVTRSNPSMTRQGQRLARLLSRRADWVANVLLAEPAA
jgi:hypothetical protein